MRWHGLFYVPVFLLLGQTGFALADNGCQKRSSNTMQATDSDYRPSNRRVRPTLQSLVDADEGWRRAAAHDDCSQSRRAAPADDGYRPRKPAPQPPPNMTQPSTAGGQHSNLYGGQYGNDYGLPPPYAGAYPYDMPGSFPPYPIDPTGQYYPGLYAPNIVYPPAPPDSTGGAGAGRKGVHP